MPRVGSALEGNARREAYRAFDARVASIVALYNERASASTEERLVIDREIELVEMRMREEWQRLAKVTGEPLATHF